MRLSSHRRLTVVGAAITALSFALLNGAFQAGGSIPDIETCTFLSAPLAALIPLYPLLAGLVAARLNAPRHSGAGMGALGAALYFAGGLLPALLDGRAAAFSPLLWLLLPLYVALASAGGWYGARASAAAGRAAAPGQGA